MVPFVVPDVLKRMPPPPGCRRSDTAAIWSDAAVWVPWALYQAYGDPAVLERQYDSMCAHVRRVGVAGVGERGLGRRGSSSATGSTRTRRRTSRGAAKADPGVVATACLYRSARILAEVADVLGRDASEFAALADRTRAAFNAAYVGADGTVQSDCTTAYTLAIVFDLLDPPIEALAGDRLAELVAKSGHRISTGFAGTPYVCEALAPHRPPRRRLRAAAAAGVPVVALPGDDGRDDGLGALGLDAARRRRSTRAR